MEDSFPKEKGVSGMKLKEYAKVAKLLEMQEDEEDLEIEYENYAA
jgi:hypothetical protein